MNSEPKSINQMSESTLVKILLQHRESSERLTLEIERLTLEIEQLQKLVFQKLTENNSLDSLVATSSNPTQPSKESSSLLLQSGNTVNQTLIKNQKPENQKTRNQSSPCNSFKIFVKLDESTISVDLLHRICSTNQKLKLITEGIYVFEFSALDFCHPLMLLGRNKKRFGWDLNLYLRTVVGFFKDTSSSFNGLITIDEGSSDFKKRISEDMAVGISSLFMVLSFKLRWETIAQIPLNRKISKLTPDFLGFNSGSEKFIYESKGTTCPKRLEASVEKALDQAKGYSDSGNSVVAKFAIVSYFASGDKSVPPFTYIADPPIDEIFYPHKNNSKLLHYICVLDFVGLESTLQAYQALLKEKFRLESLDRQETQLDMQETQRSLTQRMEREGYNPGLRRFLDRVGGEFRKESETLERFSWRERLFIGRSLGDVRESGCQLFLGVHLETIQNILNLNTDIQNIQDIQSYEEHEQISLFSDGTLLKISFLD